MRVMNLVLVAVCIIGTASAVLPQPARTVRTTTFKAWDGQYHVACGLTADCEPDLPFATQPNASAPKYTERNVDLYMEAVRSKRIEGAMMEQQPNVTQKLTAFQHRLGLYGAVGEIGVHMGLYFTSLAVHAAVTEPLVACDLFPGNPSGTTDGSGYAQLDKFKANIQSVGIDPKDVTIFEGDSRKLTSTLFASKGLPKFRLLSVDGGHTQDIAMSDMQISSCIVMEGGVMVVDDITNMEWMGVMQAVTIYVQCPDTPLVPFLIYHNKLFFTTKAYYHKYMEWAKATFKCRSDWHTSRLSIGPYEVCWPLGFA